MFEVVISVGELNALVQKVQRRLAKLAMYPWRGAGDEEIVRKIWNQVPSSLSETIEANQALQRNIVDTAIVFGGPLDDTVFLLTPIPAEGGQIVEATMLGVPGQDGKYAISFYSLIK